MKGTSSSLQSYRPKEFRRLSLTASPDFDSLYPIVSAATNWYYHLRRKPARPLFSDDQKVTIEFKELENPDYPWESLQALVPKGEDLNKDVPGVGNVVEVVADENKIYGVKISNSSSYDLYPSFFYFDDSNLCIGTTFLPIISSTAS